MSGSTEKLFNRLNNHTKMKTLGMSISVRKMMRDKNCARNYELFEVS